LFSGIGAPELILVLVIVLLLFGAKKLPEMARSLGRSSKEFKAGLQESGADEEKPEAEADAGKDVAAGPSTNGNGKAE
jgi:sec-independent protein translocase protein TatA